MTFQFINTSLPGILNTTAMFNGLSQQTANISTTQHKCGQLVFSQGSKSLIMNSHWDQTSVLTSQSCGPALSVPPTHLTSCGHSKGRQPRCHLQVRKPGFWHKTAVYKLPECSHKSLLSLSFFTCREKVRLVPVRHHWGFWKYPEGWDCMDLVHVYTLRLAQCLE